MRSRSIKRVRREELKKLHKEIDAGVHDLTGKFEDGFDEYPDTNNHENDNRDAVLGDEI